MLNIYANLLAMWQDCGMSQDLKPEDIFRINVKSRREALDWNQATLLSKLHELGYDSFHQTTLSHIEKGVQPPKLGEAIAIAQALGTRVSVLLTPPETFSVIQDFAESVAGFNDAWNRLFNALDDVDGERQLTYAYLDLAEKELNALRNESTSEATDVVELLEERVTLARTLLKRSILTEVKAHLLDPSGNARHAS